MPVVQAAGARHRTAGHRRLVGDWRATDPLASQGIPLDVTPDDLAVLIPTSGTTGRSKLVMQTHRAYAMAGEGFPYWMELTSTDRLMTSLPLFHINAPAYSVLGSLACGAGLVLLPRFSASGFIDSARRHGATEFNAIGAMLEILMRQPARADDARPTFGSATPALRLLASGSWPSSSGSVCASSAATRCRSHRTDWSGGTAPAPTAPWALRDSTPPSARSTRPGWSMTRVVTWRQGRPGAVAAQPGRNARLLGDAGRDRGRDRRRLAAHRRPGDGQRRRHVHVRLAPEGGAAPARPEPLACRGRGRDPVTPRRARGHRGGGPFGLSEEEVKAFVVPEPGRALDFEQLRGVDGRPAVRVQGPAVLAVCGRPAAHCPRRGWPSTSSRPAIRPRSTTRRSASDPRTRTDHDRIPDLDRQLRRVVHPAAGQGSGERPDGRGGLRRARLLAGGDAPADQWRAAGVRGGPGRAGRPWLHAVGDRGAAHAHRSAGVGPGGDCGGSARRRLALPGGDRGHRPLPLGGAGAARVERRTAADHRRDVGRPGP